MEIGNLIKFWRETRNVGQGTYDAGSSTTFSGINRAGGAKYMEVATNTSGSCSGYTSLGAAQMMSVPFALYPNTAGSAPGDKDGTINPAVLYILAVEV